MMTSIQSLCVFCGASQGNDPVFMEAGRALGRLMAAANVQLVFGAGGSGVMGAVSAGCLEAGGRAVGIIPQHLVEVEAALPGLTELIVVPDMHTRKRMMFERSDAFCVLPGGFGTMDETFEILTWKQLSLHEKPVILCNVKEYWKPFVQFAESMLSHSFIRQRNMELFTVVDGVEDVLAAANRTAVAETDPTASALF